MKNTKNKIVLLLMVLTVVISGCTSGGNQEDDEGSSSITVSEFSPFPNPVPATQNAQFRMELVNDGDADAENVYARLYNPPFGDSGSQVWKPTSGESMDETYRTLSFETLRAAGEQTPAVPKTRQQDFEAPDLAEGRDIDYTFNSYVMFDYSTTGNAEVQVMGEDTYRDEGSPQGSAGLENTDAPIQMEVRTPTPIPIYESGEDTTTKQFCVIARNQGSGVPFHPEVDASGENGYSISDINDRKDEIEIEIQDVGDVTFDVSDENENNYQDVSILDGKGVACFDMTISGVSDTLQRTVPIRVDATYGYRKQTRTNVQVQGQGAFDEGSGDDGSSGELSVESTDLGDGEVILNFNQDIDSDTVESGDFEITNTDEDSEINVDNVDASGSEITVSMDTGGDYSSGDSAEIEFTDEIESTEGSSINSGTESFTLPLLIDGTSTEDGEDIVLEFNEDIDSSSIDNVGDEFTVTNTDEDEEIELSGSNIDGSNVEVTMDTGDGDYNSGDDAEIEITDGLESDESDATIDTAMESFELP